MTQIALLFSFIVVAISFCSACFCFLHFLYQKGKGNQAILSLQMHTASKDAHIMQLESKLPSAIKPILGFIKMQLVYDKHLLTEKMILTERIKRNFFSFNNGVRGLNTLSLPDIKEYHFSDALISFEDMLQFFSFTINIPQSKSLLNLPQSSDPVIEEMNPRKTEEEKIRITTLRKVQGEYLNYKKFEDADDVRRIVWKIFAKHKELVVRVPEIMDPFASHIYMYASFYVDKSFSTQGEFQQEMSNYFKNAVWSVFDVLHEKEFEVKYISDQHSNSQSTTPDETGLILTRANWHHHVELSDYFKAQHASVLCLHSLSSVVDIERTFNDSANHVRVFFIPLSKVFHSQVILNWLMKIIFKPKPDRLNALRSKWVFHPLKFKLQKNEQAILKILKQQNIQFEIM
ncbi:MAG: hypothetical protein IPI46_10105 [Bacteroidetes bacterium]|nr:hypothetical protein [Bacteroidota bacterium]